MSKGQTYLDEMTKTIGQSFFGFAELRAYMDKPINFDENFELTDDKTLYSEEELEAINCCLAMEKGMFRG